MDKRMIIEKVRNEQVVATHYGDDLDNRSAIYALAQAAGLSVEDIDVRRVSAGEIVAGVVNVDTGGHTGPEVHDDGTVIIDGDGDEYQSAVAVLADLGFDILEQIVELADAGADSEADILDYRTGLALLRYIEDTGVVFWMAREGLLDQRLTDEQLATFGLREAAMKQADVILEATKAVADGRVRWPDEDLYKLIIVEEYVPAGSQVAYRLYGDSVIYASVTKHAEGDGCTFAVTTNDERGLPMMLVEALEDLGEKFGTKGKGEVFAHPNGQMLVAGGPKVPEFRITADVEDVAREIKRGRGVPRQYW
jgi:hypothetical protein